MKSVISDKEACTRRLYFITKKDLPLSCPPRDKRVWDAHPRVYLPIKELGQVVCPYCGAEYILQGDTATQDEE